MKICRECGIEKPNSSFYGRNGKCILCYNARNSMERKKHKEYYKVLRRQQYLKRKEKLRLKKIKES